MCLYERRNRAQRTSISFRCNCNAINLYGNTIFRIRSQTNDIFSSAKLKQSSFDDIWLFDKFIDNLPQVRKQQRSDGDLSEKSQLLGLLGNFYQRLSKSTNIKQINKMKNINGSEKAPYLLCLMHNIHKELEAGKERFKSFFKQGNLSKDHKRSCEALSEYFLNRIGYFLPNFTESSLHYRNYCIRMKNDIISKLACRKINNFELTGALLYNLLILYCENFNQKKKQIDFVKLFTECIQMEKNRLEANMLDSYFDLVSKMIPKQILPIDTQELRNLHQEIVNKIYNKISETAINCMNLNQFLVVQKNVRNQINKNLVHLLQENQKDSEKLCSNLFIQLSKAPKDKPDTAQDIIAKIDVFHNKAEGPRSQNYLIQLIAQLFTNFALFNQELLEIQQKELKQLQMKSHRYKLDITLLEQKQKEYDARLSVKLIEKQSYSLGMHQQKQKKEKMQKKLQKYKDAKITILNLEKKIKDFDEETLRKTTEIEDLYLTVERYQNIIQKDKGKSRSKCEFARLVNAFKDSATVFHNTCTQLETIDETIKTIKIDFQKKKVELLKQRDRLLQNVIQLKQDRKGMQILQEELTKKLRKSQETINLYQKIGEQMKNNLEKKETENSMKAIQIANFEMKIWNYHKSIEHIKTYFKTGKTDSLHKFMKVLHDDEIKNDLLFILK